MAMTGHGKRPFGKELIFAGVLGVAFVIFLIQFSRSWMFEASHPLKGQQAPEIEYKTKDGKSSSLAKHKGTTVLINFWASWCPPCMDEMPSLVALEKHYADKGLLLLALNIEDADGDHIEGRIAGSKMPRNLIYNFPKEALRPYGVISVPLSILIDKDGVVQRVWTGPRDWMKIEMLQDIEGLLNK